MKYFVERYGDLWQSVFPEHEADLSQLHTTLEDALDYISEVKPLAEPLVLNARTG